MGSYITIVNDTNEEWICKLNYDSRPVRVTTWMVGIITMLNALLVTFSTAGIGTPLAAYTVVGGGFLITGLTRDMVHPLGAVVMKDKVMGPDNLPPNLPSMFTQTVTQALIDRLMQKGFNTIKPHENHRYGKMSLSLWQQATCVYIETRDAKNLVLHTLYMRPIFSGSTINSTREYSIGNWTKKQGHVEVTQITGILEPLFGTSPVVGTVAPSPEMNTTNTL